MSAERPPSFDRATVIGLAGLALFIIVVAGVVWLIFFVASENIFDRFGAAKDAVRQGMLDPAATQFRSLTNCPKDPAIVAGEVNGKNRLGAYVGFEPFFYDGRRVALVGSGEFEPMMGRCYGNTVATPAPEAAPSAAAPVEEPASSNWLTSEDTNPVDDSKTRRAFLIADEGHSSTGDSISLTIRCQSNETELYVNWNDYLGDDSYDHDGNLKDITVRVGKDAAEQQQWSTSTDSQASFAPDPVYLIRRMLEAQRLVVVTTPYNESPITAVFNLKGIREAVMPIAHECGWKLAGEKGGD